MPGSVGSNRGLATPESSLSRASLRQAQVHLYRTEILEKAAVMTNLPIPGHSMKSEWPHRSIELFGERHAIGDGAHRMRTAKVSAHTYTFDLIRGGGIAVNHDGAAYAKSEHIEL